MYLLNVHENLSIECLVRGARHSICKKHCLLDNTRTCLCTDEYYFVS